MKVFRVSLLLLAAFATSVSYAQTQTVASRFASDTRLAIGMWAAQTDPHTITLAWNHIPEAKSYTVSCAFGTAAPKIITTVNATGLSATDENGLPRRLTATVPITAGAVLHRCFLQYNRTPILSTRIPFNELTPTITNAAASQTAPASVTASVTGPGEVTVSWTPVTGATGYVVSRSSSPDVMAVFCKYCSTRTTYVDRTAQAGLHYVYAVSAITAGGESPKALSNTVVTPGATGETSVARSKRLPPRPPSRVTATVDSGDAVVLHWTPVPGAAGYEVFRSVDHAKMQSTGFVNVAAPADEIRFRDNVGSFVSVHRHVVIRYAVRSLDEDGLASKITSSNEVRAGEQLPLQPRKQ